jgi:quinol-cytochrome oxidoreductase complex cytochrome b subunit
MQWIGNNWGLLLLLLGVLAFHLFAHGKHGGKNPRKDSGEKKATRKAGAKAGSAKSDLKTPGT